ncbi:MAG: hypothetical protein LBS25_08190 [Candidatus Symbiothrix sp.]|jgi:hypothetical protein|nr:hypothetical protein [Candidatus Symbiothrix sp.]
MKTIIAIPVYKEQPDRPELTSLRQCLTVLSKHTICMVVPENLNTEIYQAEFQKHDVPFRKENFNPDFFQSIDGYNQLLMSKHFYERFADFDYLLIYQLDAYVFRDELDECCAKGYDYIGAPFQRVNGRLDDENSGNGGFSLRKITSFIDIFSYKGKLLTWKGLQCYHRYRGPLHKPWLILSGLFGRCNSVQSLMADTDAEDLFYVTLKHKRKGKWKIPNSAEAMFFSFEQSPSVLFQRTKRLPFGCHGWLKYEYDSFWKQYIPL